MNKSESLQSKDQDVRDSSLSANSKSKQKGRGKKRKRPASESSSDEELVLPENTLEVEKNLHASAIKNNLDDVSVKKILKKVVTNDHVLALVKLREEEEDSSTEESLRPKLTRAKVKELMKVSPKSAPWNLELTPIKHIPVKTRPEVKALIAQELPEDEDDEEYEPTPDDVPSDDDHTLESSDIDSLPRTPATPKSQKKSMLKVVNDGPFKVPQPELSNAARRKLVLEEEATIALRTRSKLSLSSTSIEHIESSFVPPDDLPTPDVDSLWNNFLNDCLNPASNSRHEEDDDADPEYNVAADPDAQEEDEEALENSIIKISKKELNDLVTELFNIMPDTTTDLAENMVQEMITGGAQTEQTNRWEGKQEPVSDEENNTQANAMAAHLLQAMKVENVKIDNAIRLSIGKNEPPDEEEGTGEMVIDEERINEDNSNENESMEPSENTVDKPAIVQKSIPTVNKQPIVNNKESDGNQYPAVLQQMAVKEQEEVQVEIPKNEVMYPEQRTLLEQQLRQHVQLAAAAFMQLFVHPVQWHRATTYKEFLTTLNEMVDDKPSSVVNVCNLKPAVDLIAGWEASVSEPSPENIEMVKFLQKEVDKHRQRCDNHSLYVGEFPEMYMKVVANSTVFLYPYLLPAMPFKPDFMRRFGYLRSEDEYITLGLAQFWEYVRANPALYKPPVNHQQHRWGLAATVRLVVKYMLPWMTPKTLMAHICTCRKKAGPENPIVKFFKTNTLTPVKHKLLSFNPHITLYEQPEVELPRIWLRYLANTSKRFKTFYNKRKSILNGQPPDGVEIDTAVIHGVPKKVPLSIDFTKKISCNRLNTTKPKEKSTETLVNKIDVSINNGSGVPVLTPITLLDNNDQGVKPFKPANIFTVVNTGNGSYLVPLNLPETSTVNSNTTPICAPTEGTVEDTETDDVRTVATTDKTDPDPTDNVHITQTKSDEHCTCCVLLRKIWKPKQKTIFDYFKPKLKTNNCDCKGRRYPPLTNRLRLLVNHYKTNAQCVYLELNEKIRSLQREINNEKDNIENNSDFISDDDEETDVAVALAFHLKLGFRSQLVRDYGVKKRIQTVFTRFKPDQDVNATLTSVLAKVFDVELVDLYKEFIGFLTPEQADSIGHFKDYFVQRCVQKLAARIEASVSDKEKRCNLLEYLSNNFSSNAFHKWPACEICTDILGHVQEWPELAKYVFSLFPHKRKESPSHQPQSTIEDTVTKKETFASNEPPWTNDHSSPTHKPESAVEGTMLEDETLAGHEADHSSNEGDEANTGDETNEDDDEKNDDREPASQEMDILDIKPEEIVLGELNISIQKTVDSDPSNTPTLSLVIRPLTSLPNEDPLKIEEPEWKREEDKVILEILKQHITPEDRRDKSIVDMIEESPVVQIIAESLPHKSADEVMERVFYLLQLLATGEQLKTSE